MTDNVNHPPHYKKHPSGVECIEITRHMNFNLGNAVKYIWRAGEKGKQLEDLQKAAWYINDEISRLRSLETLRPAPSDPVEAGPVGVRSETIDEVLANPRKYEGSIWEIVYKDC